MATVSGNDRQQQRSETQQNGPQGQNASAEQRGSEQRGSGQGAQQGLARQGETRGRALAPQGVDYGARSPFGLMRRLMEDMDQVFGGFGSLGGLGPFGGLGGIVPREIGQGLTSLWQPQIEVFERDGKLVMRADLPGVQKDAVQLRVEDDVLYVSGERRDERKEEREGWYHSERSYGSFQRGIQLPPGVNQDQIQASFDNGVLEVIVPVPEMKARGRTIAIGEKGGGGKQVGVSSEPTNKLRGSS